ncbi:hypothetical protein EFJ98_20270 [Pseudomonas putida]|nr:hypothetical protein EFJ98_20270 [Pseudomonas putida]
MNRCCGLARSFVGAALCRERAAKRPPDFCIVAKIAGAALRPFRDTRPLLHGGSRCGSSLLQLASR